MYKRCNVIIPNFFIVIHFLKKRTNILPPQIIIFDDWPFDPLLNKWLLILSMRREALWTILEAPARIERRALYSGTARSSIGCAQLREEHRPDAFLHTKAIKQISPAAGLHATLRRRCLNRDVKVCLRNRRLRMQRTVTAKKNFIPNPAGMEIDCTLGGGRILCVRVAYCR